MLAAIRRASSLAIWPECRLDLETMHRRQRNCARFPKRFRQSRIDRYAPQRGNGRAVLFHRRISEGEEDKGFLETHRAPRKTLRSGARAAGAAGSAPSAGSYIRRVPLRRLTANAHGFLLSPSPETTSSLAKGATFLLPVSPKKDPMPVLGQSVELARFQRGCDGRAPGDWWQDPA
jgi:hypothetical protein